MDYRFNNKKEFLLLLCFIVGLYSSAFTWASEVVPAKKCRSDITSIAVAQTDQAPILENTQNLQWVNLAKTPDHWTKRWKNYSGAAWYKINWKQSCIDNEQPVMLLIKSITMAGKIYVNDTLLWQDKSLVEPLSRSWNTPRQWYLTASTIQEGENTLWIYVKGSPTYISGLGKVNIGEPQQYQSVYDYYVLEQKTLHHIKLLFSILIGFICIFIWILQWTKEKALGLYGLSQFSWIGYVFTAFYEESVFGLNSIDLQRLTIWFFSSYAVVCFFYGNRFAEQYYPKIEKWVWICFALTTIALIFLPEPYILIALNLIFIFWAVFCLSYYVAYSYIAYRAKMAEVYLLAVIYLILVPIGIHDAMYMINHEEGRAISPYTTPITTLFISMILALRLSKNVKKIEAFNQTLSQTVERVKTELIHTLNNSHQLELENTKLQERIHLAHELHDSLGGSLVRSMAMVSQSKETISNQQTLSMLKLLRDDLRQIIDGGSSLGATIPETPELWIAPVRYRFNSLFDELDIETHWDVAKEWQGSVSPIDCLTLQRVIEEALTNVIKHSHATAVSVQFGFNEQKQMILEITDNGIGFDVASVYAASISVGLRSLKTRLEKINAQIKIESKPTGTRIQIIK